MVDSPPSKITARTAIGIGIALMGGGTTRVGDPTGKDESRKVLSEEVIETNKAGIKTNFANFIDFQDASNAALMLDNADWLLDLIQSLDHPNVGLVVDFDNWCVAYENGTLWGKNCIQEYPRYEGMQKLLPYADNISVKAFVFDTYGEDSKTDFKQMAQIIDSLGFKGSFGVEYEGDQLMPGQGAVKTRQLISKHLEAISSNP